MRKPSPPTNADCKFSGTTGMSKGWKCGERGDNGIFIGGNYNIIENVETHHNRDSGLQISRSSSSMTNIADWPSYNQIIRVYSHDNFDPDNGEDADGFAAKLTIGPGNVFDSCIAAWNTDDGWDLYTKSETGAIGAVTIKNSIAYKNGQTSDGNSTSDSDGNGFKLGGDKIAVNHIVQNSVAFQNKNTASPTTATRVPLHSRTIPPGATDKAISPLTKARTYSRTTCRTPGEPATKRAEPMPPAAMSGGKTKKAPNAKGLVASDADFVSLTPSVTRNADGSFSLGNFLKLAAGSDLIGSGTPSGTNIGATMP
ncbi:hypothetical protein HMSSN036_75490 [Paenibacillus macerans]|nr:hypothetical protein HMSSN036_75490 [Paenibacillus macerans]